jgi:DNA polymerase
MSDIKKEQMKAIRDEVLELKSSSLYQYRMDNGYFPVIGEGSYEATIMFIGEAPGKNEAKTARPFCGTAGKILDELLVSINLLRENVYITNIVKDRPPENRDPTPDEIALYAPYLNRQIDIIRPRVLATLGRFSMQYILQKYQSAECFNTISNLHGRVIEVEDSFGPLLIVPLYHPAAAIYNQSLKETLKRDFQVLKTLI